MEGTYVSAVQIKEFIKQIKAHLRAIYIESGRFGVPTIPTVETLLKLRPESAHMLLRLSELGVSWDYLIKYSDLDNLRIRLKDVAPIKLPSRSAKIEKKLYFVVNRIRELFEEMKRYGDTIPYLSRDVFCTIHADADQVLEGLEQKHVNWTTLLRLAGVPLAEMLPPDTKRQAALHCKTFLESSGLTTKHLILLQKLIVFTRAENPGTLDKFVKDTFGVTVVNDRFYTYMLSRISDVINYLNSIA
jgi:hypothetical protein